MCGSRDTRVFGMRLNKRQGLRPRQAQGIAVTIKKCHDCGLVFPDPLPIPESLADHYGIPAESYWARLPDWDPAYFGREIAAAKRLIDFKPGMKALDIGAGSGGAMLSLAHAGFETWGIEPSASFREYAVTKRNVPSERLLHAALEDSEFEENSFDFITFGAVLEHLFDPHASLTKALSWLKPGGVIQAEVPSSDWLVGRLVNAYFRLRGTNYITNLSPMHSLFHLYEFTLRSFADFRVVEHWIEVCSQPHIPGALKPLLAQVMKRTGTGMQLTVFIGKK